MTRKEKIQIKKQLKELRLKSLTIMRDVQNYRGETVRMGGYFEFSWCYSGEDADVAWDSHPENIEEGEYPDFTYIDNLCRFIGLLECHGFTFEEIETAILAECIE